MPSSTSHTFFSTFPPGMGAGLGELLRISWLDVCNLALKRCWLAILITNVWVHKKTIENNMADLSSHIPTIFILSTSCHIFFIFLGERDTCKSIKTSCSHLSCPRLPVLSQNRLPDLIWGYSFTCSSSSQFYVCIHKLFISCLFLKFLYKYLNVFLQLLLVTWSLYNLSKVVYVALVHLFSLWGRILLYISTILLLYISIVI